MRSIDELVPILVRENLTPAENEYLQKVFAQFRGYPSLQQMWALMDDVWVELGCDPEHLDDRITSYYEHPVWLLNGLFVEQHSESVAHRLAFAGWVIDQAPERVADIGGGFGGLARIIGEALPTATVEVLEPHPSPDAKALAAATANVRYVPTLTGSYDLLIATDVFEHVPDPIELAVSTAGCLRPDGQYLMANCFKPVIRCHLPQNMHFDVSWERVMNQLGMESICNIAHATTYRRTGALNIAAANSAALLGKKLYSTVSWLPIFGLRVGRFMLKYMPI